MLKSCCMEVRPAVLDFHLSGTPRIQTIPEVVTYDPEQEKELTCAEIGIHWDLSGYGLMQLHGVLLDACLADLEEPETPLSEVIDWLCWIFGDESKQYLPFSFANCLRLFQRPNVRALLEDLKSGVKQHLTRRLDQYPDSVAKEFWSNPDWFAAKLEGDPQWLNKQLKVPQSATNQMVLPI